MSEGIYLFNVEQALIESVSTENLIENYQVQELNGQIYGVAKAVYKKSIEDAVYFGVKDKNNFWMYKVRKVTKEDGMITLEGIHVFFDELKGHVIRDIRPQNTQASVVVEKILDGTGWSLGASFVSDQASTNFYHVSKLHAFYEAVKIWDFEFIPVIRFSDGKIVSKSVNIYKQISTDYGKWYEYGDKLLSVIAESSTDELYTAFIGRGKGIPIEDGQGNLTGGFSRKIKFDELEYSNSKDGITVNKPIGQDYIEIKEVTNAFGYPDGSPRIGIVDFDNIEDINELADATFDYALKNCRPKLQLKAEALEGDTVELGETVVIIRSDMNIRYKVRIFKIKKDFLQDRVLSYEFGDKIVSSIGERLKSESYEKKKRDELVESYIDSLRDEINSSYFNDSAYNYDLKIGNKYGLPAGYYSFDKPIDKNPDKVIYMGAGKMLISNAKNPDGSWKWQTMSTGDGVVAESIVGTLGEFAKVNASQINVNNDFIETALGQKVVVQDTLYNNIKITPASGLQVLDNQNRERVQLGNWAPGKYGLKLTDTSGNRTVLDDSGILQSWQDSKADNIDSTSPLKLYVYIPSETRTIYKALLRAYTSNFRAYTKGAETINNTYTSTSSGGGSYSNTSSSSNGGQASTTGNESSVQGGMETIYLYEDNVINYSKWISHYVVTSHQHYYQNQSHAHDVTISVPTHTHDQTIPGHGHANIYGIYEEYNNTRYTIFINGYNRTSILTGATQFTSNINGVEITPYLTVGMWNTIEIRGNNRGRVDASIFVQALLNHS